MTDKEIIQGLISRDNHITEIFFFVKCRPLFYTIMKRVFKSEIDYEELVNELYVYLMENDAIKLQKFQYRCSIYQWLKVLTIRFFIKKRGKLIDDTKQEDLYYEQEQQDVSEQNESAEGDVHRLFDKMPNKRYVYVIQRLILDDWEPEQLAKEMNIATANLYNIKRRAIAQLTHVALNDIKEYGK